MSVVLERRSGAPSDFLSWHLDFPEVEIIFLEMGNVLTDFDLCIPLTRRARGNQGHPFGMGVRRPHGETHPFMQNGPPS